MCPAIKFSLSCWFSNILKKGIALLFCTEITNVDVTVYSIPHSLQGTMALLIIPSEENVNSYSIHASMDIIVRGHIKMAYNFLYQFRHYTEQIIAMHCSCDHMSVTQCHSRAREQGRSSTLHSIFSCQILNVCLLSCEAWSTWFCLSWLIFS